MLFVILFGLYSFILFLLNISDGGMTDDSFVDKFSNIVINSQLDGPLRKANFKKILRQVFFTDTTDTTDNDNGSGSKGESSGISASGGTNPSSTRENPTQLPTTPLFPVNADEPKPTSLPVSSPKQNPMETDSLLPSTTRVDGFSSACQPFSIDLAGLFVFVSFGIVFVNEFRNM